MRSKSSHMFNTFTLTLKLFKKYHRSRKILIIMNNIIITTTIIIVFTIITIWDFHKNIHDDLIITIIVKKFLQANDLVSVFKHNKNLMF